MRRAFLIALLAATPLSGPVAAQTSAPAVAPAPPSDETVLRAARTVLALAQAAQAQPGASPALSIVLVRRGQPPMIWTQGRLSADPVSAPATDDTSFYIASQTKAFMGLLAVKLDAQGVFALDQTLADVWPDLTLPDGADPKAVTFRQLLSHQAPFETAALSFRTAYSDRVPASDYGRLMQAGSTARPAGFRYSNLGYLVYAAALELETGRDWRDWLDQALFQPLGMSRSGARASRFDDLPVYHRWMGERGWDVFPGKPDDLMHAAGGLVVSPRDMARWLQVQLGAANDAVRPEWVTTAQTPVVAADIQGDVLPCQGYALGWNICRIGGVDVRIHGGAYTGMRSAMAVSPELGVAIAVFSTSDSLTGGLSQTLIQALFETVQNTGFAAPTGQAFGEQYAARLASFGQRRMAQVDQRRAEAQWAGWAWRPSAAARAAYAGRYRHPTFGDFEVTTDGETVHARLGVVDHVLEPAAPDLFGVADGAADPPAPLRFERTGDRVTALVWDDERFERVD
ncbi:MAG: beta-lactamase family protein [Caulobacterales bacterium]|nr:beta-lactamase family protein [Caulobacterales bacterium]